MSDGVSTDPQKAPAPKFFLEIEFDEWGMFRFSSIISIIHH